MYGYKEFGTEFVNPNFADCARVHDQVYMHLTGSLIVCSRDNLVLWKKERV